MVVFILLVSIFIVSLRNTEVTVVLASSNRSWTPVTSSQRAAFSSTEHSGLTKENNHPRSTSISR